MRFKNQIAALHSVARNDGKILWTAHSRAKMRFYGLSEGRVRRVIHSPKRIEEGIAPNTVAMMQPVSPKYVSETGKREETWTQEIWVMLQRMRIRADRDADKRRYRKISENQRKNPRGSAVIKIISAWRYPGRTKPGQPIPEEILREVKSFL